MVLDSEQMLRPVKRRRRPWVAILILLLLAALAAGGGFAVSKFMPELIPTLLQKAGLGDAEGPDVLPTIAPAPTLVPEAGRVAATAEPSRTPRPVSISNNKIVTESAYRGVCPVKVKAVGGNMLVVLVYDRAPDHSDEAREPLDPAFAPESDSIAFYVEAGKSAQVNVPIGVYRLYYACGTEYYGRNSLFGASTRRYVLDGSWIVCARNGKTYAGVNLVLRAKGGEGVTAVTAARFPQE